MILRGLCNWSSGRAKCVAQTDKSLVLRMPLLRESVAARGRARLVWNLPYAHTLPHKMASRWRLGPRQHCSLSRALRWASP